MYLSFPSQFQDEYPITSPLDFCSSLLCVLPISRHLLYPSQDIAYWHRLLSRQISIKHRGFCHYSMSRPPQIPFPMKFKLSNQAFKFNFLQQILKVLQLIQFNLCPEPCLLFLSFMYPSFKSGCTTNEISALFFHSSYECLHRHCPSSDPLSSNEVKSNLSHPHSDVTSILKNPPSNK